MKIIISFLILFSSMTITGYGQHTTNKPTNFVLRSSVSHDFDIADFKALPKKYNQVDRAYLIDEIKPSLNYKYWECIFKDFAVKDRGDVIVYNGDILYSTFAKKVNSDYGFFVECLPAICFSYIVAVRSDRTTELINSNAKLKEFIGHIDNLEEAILVAKINGYWYDSDTIIGGAYKERDKDYLLYLLDYSSTPVTYKSVKAILTKEGDFRVIDKKIYKQTDEYIME